MIELLLEADRALSVGFVDQAERLYRQAADTDPRNSIAVVGLARVALERTDDDEAYRQARRALTIDPENVAAQRLVARLEEVFAARGQPLPDPASTPPTASPARRAQPAATPAASDGPPDASESPPDASDTPPAMTDASPAAGRPAATPSSSLVDRLLRRNHA